MNIIPPYTYIIESILATGILYTLYILALRNRPMLVFNRFVLLFMIVLGITLPLITFQLPQTTEIVTSGIILEAIEYETVDFIVYSEASRQINYWQWIYISVTSVLLCFLLFRLIEIQKFVRKSSKSEARDFSYHLILGKYTHFSFFNKIFINQSLVETEDELNSILEHEKIHVQQKHTIDILFLEIFKVFLWFNPFLWLFKKCVTENHEYLADKNMLKNTSKNIAEYFNELLYSSLRTYNISLANNFNHSILKKRIIMMTRKLKTAERLIPILIVPIIFSLGVFFACTNNEAYSEIQELGDIDIEPKTYDRIDYFEARSFTLGNDNSKNNPFHKYVQNNLVYPKAAFDKKIGGIVWVEFDVTRKGKIKNVEIVNNVHPLLDAEALRVVESCPDWDMGVAATQGPEITTMKFPVVFDLNMNKDQQTKNEKLLYQVDEMPRFDGGDFNKFRKYLANNLVYPKEALENGTMGSVYVQFVVGTEGKVRNANVIRSVDPLLDAESLRLVKSSPDWIPGKLGDRNIAVQLITPVDFFFGEKKLEMKKKEEERNLSEKEVKSEVGVALLIIKNEKVKGREQEFFIQCANNFVEYTEGEAEFTFDLTENFQIENITIGISTNTMLSSMTKFILQNNQEMIKSTVNETKNYEGKIVVEQKPAGTDIIINIK